MNRYGCSVVLGITGAEDHAHWPIGQLWPDPARYNSRPGTAEADHQEGPMESAPRGTRPGPKAAQVTA